MMGQFRPKNMGRAFMVVEPSSALADKLFISSARWSVMVTLASFVTRNYLLLCDKWFRAKYLANMCQISRRLT